MSAVPSHPDGSPVLVETAKQTGRRGRRRGVEIKPGSARQARLEAGLSLGQVAGGQLSRTAIYFVETGKAKPSMETLTLIAERTGRPLGFFLATGAEDPQLLAGTDEVERLLAINDLANVVAAGEKLLERKLDLDTQARLRHLVAMAYVRQGQPVLGRRLASAARIHYERTGDLVMTAECLCSEAQGAYLMQDPSALSLAEGALATGRSARYLPPSTETRLLATLAGVHATNRNWQAAIDAYEAAIAVGDSVQDLRGLSLTYSGLSLSYQELGQVERATHYSQRALAIHETLNDRLSLARTENNLGLLLLRAGQVVAARPHIERSLHLFEETGVEIGKSDVLVSLAELAAAEGNFELASELAHDGLAIAEKEMAPGSIADGHVWLGRIAAAQGQDDACDKEFVTAFEVLESSGGRERLSRARVAYAEILERRGDLAGANRQLREALAAPAHWAHGPESRAATA
ncbi:MAG: helix-turn-helix domain-containing protein [Candidatus Dormibacteraceae bacterium]